MSNRSKTIAARAMMAAQMAVVVRTEAKKVLKHERKQNGVPPYFVQSITTMISKTSEQASQSAAAALAALEYSTLNRKSRSALQTADALSKSAAHQALSAKCLHEALILSVESMDKQYDADTE